MRCRLAPRESSPRWLLLATPVAAIAATLACGLLAGGAVGISPAAAIDAFFLAPVRDWYGLSELLVKAAPLALIASGLSIGFRANVWNIGAEGQLVLGAIAASGLALYVPELGPLLLPAMVLAGGLGGLAWSAVPAWLRARFGASEILVSLMLSYVALLLLSYLVHGPWRDPAGYNFPESALFPPQALMPVLLDDTRLHLGTGLAVLALAAAWTFGARSYLAFQMHVAGIAPGAAGYAGFSAPRVIWVGLLTGGTAAGLAGAAEVAGPIGQLLPNISPGYGYAAIVVAFVGRLHPLGIGLASLLIAWLYLGAETAQVRLSVPSSITGLAQGTLLFFLLTADLFARYRLEPVRPAQNGKVPTCPETAAL